MSDTAPTTQQRVPHGPTTIAQRMIALNPDDRRRLREAILLQLEIGYIQKNPSFALDMGIDVEGDRPV